MVSRKHNEFLDIEDSDSDQSERYISADDDLRKGGRVSKRQKVENQDDKSSGLKELNDAGKTKEKLIQKTEISELQGLSKPLTKENLVATTEAIKRSGVVYLSRIPPFMKPTKLRSLLEPYGRINRIFLTPEDPKSHTRRVRNGGNKKRSFVDGWVEFVKKTDAKAVCELLNGRIIGGKKGTYYHDDVWNLLYLKGFKWNNLTEQIIAENAEKASRMRAEITKATKENKEFVKNVERAKMLEGIEAKKLAKGKIETQETQENQENQASESVFQEKVKMKRRLRDFKQTPVASKNQVDEHPEQVMKVLSKIF